MKFYISILIFILHIVFSRQLFAQSGIPTENTSERSYTRFVCKTTRAMDNLTVRINKNSNRYIKKYKRAEKKSLKKLCKINPLAGDKLIAAGNSELLKNETYSPALKRVKVVNGPYFAELDSLKCISNYLTSHAQNPNDKKIVRLQKSTQNLELAVVKSNELQAYFRKQKIYLGKLADADSNLKNEFTRFDKINYYYAQKIIHDKNSFCESLEFLQKNNFYQTFSLDPKIQNYIGRFGQLSEFGNGLSANVTELKGAQTLVETQEKLTEQLALLSKVGKSFKNPTLSDFVNSKHSGLGNFSSGNFSDLPSFKPNTLKALRFKERLVRGFNYSIYNFNNFYPANANIDVSLGYKTVDKFLLGIGFSNQLYLGSSWEDIHVEVVNYGVSAFVDYSLIKLVSITGIYELNKPVKESAGSEYYVVNNKKRLRNDWTSVYLIGLKLKYKLSSNKGCATISLLYDVLNTSPNSNSVPIIYKVGWEW